MVNNDRLFYEIDGGQTTVQIRKIDVIKFISRSILSRFGIPRAFLSVNRTLFVRQKVKNLFGQLKIEFYNSTSSYS